MRFNRQVLFSILALVCLAILTHLPMGARQIPLRKSFEDFPTAIGQWKHSGHVKDDETAPGLAGAHDHLAREYRDHKGNEVRLYVSYLERQTEGKEAMVGIRNYLGERFSGWEIVDQKVYRLAIPDYHKKGIKVNECIIRNGPKQQLVLYWYQVGGNYTPSRYGARILLVFNTIFRNRRDGAFICLSAPTVSQKNIRDFGKLIAPILSNTYLSSK